MGHMNYCMFRKNLENTFWLFICIPYSEYSEQQEVFFYGK